MLVAEDTQRLAERCQALSDPKRLAVLALLREGERCVCDLQSALDLPQPLLSFHLRILRDHDFVSCRRKGRWAYYALKPEGFRDVVANIGVLGVRR